MVPMKVFLFLFLRQTATQSPKAEYERRENGVSHEERLPENIRMRLVTGFKIACVKDRFDNLYDLFELDRISKSETLKSVLISSIKSYQFLDFDGNICEPEKVISAAMSKVQANGVLINILDEVTDIVFSQYRIITDRRRLSSSLKGRNQAPRRAGVGSAVFRL